MTNSNTASGDESPRWWLCIAARDYGRPQVWCLSHPGTFRWLLACVLGLWSAPARAIPVPLENVEIAPLARDTEKSSFSVFAIHLLGGGTLRRRETEREVPIAVPPQFGDAPTETEEEVETHGSAAAELGAEFRAIGLGSFALHAEAGAVLVSDNSGTWLARPVGKFHAALGKRRDCVVAGEVVGTYHGQEAREVDGYQLCMFSAVVGAGSMEGWSSLASNTVYSPYMDFGIEYASESSVYRITVAKFVPEPGWGLIFSRRSVPLWGSSIGLLIDLGASWGRRPFEDVDVKGSHGALWTSLGISWGSDVWGASSEPRPRQGSR